MPCVQAGCGRAWVEKEQRERLMRQLQRPSGSPRSLMTVPLVDSSGTESASNGEWRDRHMQIRTGHQHAAMPRDITDLRQRSSTGQRVADEGVAPVVDGQGALSIAAEDLAGGEKPMA